MPHSSPADKLAVSLAVLAKATLLHKARLLAGEQCCAKPMCHRDAYGTSCHDAAHLDPWVLQVLSHDGSTRAERSSLGPRDMGDHPVAPLGESPRRSPQNHQGSSGKIPFPFGVQDLNPS